MFTSRSHAPAWERVNPAGKALKGRTGTAQGRGKSDAFHERPGSIIDPNKSPEGAF